MAKRLSEQRIGLIGVGVMGESILRGALNAGVVSPGNIWVNDIIPERMKQVAEQYGVHAAESAAALFAEVDWAQFSAKPQNLDDLLPELADALQPGQWLSSIAAGVSTKRIEAGLPDGTPVIRVMPNIAATVAQAMTCICAGTHAEESHLQSAEKLFAAVGKTSRVSETLMDAVTGLSGSGPAFVFLVIEALADAGVREGLSFDQARLLASQTVLGAAMMAAETPDHPAVWKSRVTSAGGTTAAGLAALERFGARAAFSEAVRAATERSVELGGA